MPGRGSGLRQLHIAALGLDYYSEQLRKATYDFDVAQVRPYFELNRVLRDGLFHVAHELYGLTFQERFDLPLYQHDARLFEYLTPMGATGAVLATTTRATTNRRRLDEQLVTQSRLVDLKPVVVNSLNIPRRQPASRRC